MTHEQLIESAASYALDALDPADRATFEAHLAGCAECKDAVAAYREVVGALVHAAPAAAPPNSAALRDRIMREARGVRPIGVVPRPSRDGAPVTSASVSAVKPGPRRISWAVAVASLAAALVFAIVYRTERDRNARLSSELASLRTELARDDSVLAAFVGPMVHVVSLAAASEQPAVRVFWNHTRRQFIVTTFRLPPAPAGKTYQLWALRNGQPPLSMGTFAVNAGGRTVMTLPVSSGINAAGLVDDCALTIEPDGGSPQPTEAPRLIGSWRHVD